ncbi:undecaprenyl-diphosphate phosphatase [bacterium]|nr:undecaprenyl-diphosphate phosphatase [bacterium]MCP5462568.1 undecaprenyl-diphosphate phosphatase [bacterium]
MELWVAVILGIVQGLTEFLPISSSAHLAILQKIFPVQDNLEMFFDLTIHMGTLFAVTVFYFEDIRKIAHSIMIRPSGWNKAFETDFNFRLAYYIMLSTLFTGVAGLLFRDLVEQAFRNVHLVAYALMCTGLLLLIVERKSKKSRHFDAFSWRDALIIGVFQTWALFPGISRSGTTIACAMMLGFAKSDSARYSFLLSIPAIIGAFSLQLLEMLNMGIELAWLKPLAVGFICSLFFGYLAIKLILLVLRGNKLFCFSIYCWVLSLIVLLFL